MGSRYVAGGKIENWPLMRKVLSVDANALARGISGKEVRDWTSGFRHKDFLYLFGGKWDAR